MFTYSYVALRPLVASGWGPWETPLVGADAELTQLQRCHCPGLFLANHCLCWICADLEIGQSLLQHVGQFGVGVNSLVVQNWYERN